MTSHAGTIVRSARKRRRLTQHALAARSGIAQPNIAAIESKATGATITTLDRLLAATGDQLTVLPTREATATDTAEYVASLLRDGKKRSAYRAVLAFHDGLVRSDPAVRVALAVAPPSLIGDTRWDALLAGIVEHGLQSLPKPAWLVEAERVAEGWFVDEDAPVVMRPRIKASTPRALRRHGVFLDRAELASV
jgi:transcriptional regulator with XRE-family HTH domain